MNPYAYKRGSRVTEKIQPVGSVNGGLSFIKSALNAKIGSATALSFVLFVAVSVGAMTTVAYSEISNAPLVSEYLTAGAHHPMVLGAATPYGYNQPVCNSGYCLGYQLLGFYSGQWQAFLTYTFPSYVKQGVVLQNGAVIAQNLSGSNSIYTGYNLAPNQNFTFSLYTSNRGLNSRSNPARASVTFTTPADPTYYYKKPVRPINISTKDSLQGYVGTYFTANFYVTGGYVDGLVTNSSNAYYSISTSHTIPPGLDTTRRYCAPSYGYSSTCSNSNNLITLFGTPTQSGTYYITIYATDGQGNSTSQVFTFTINPVTPQPTSITVNSPGGGEQWGTGTNQVISWYAPSSVASVNISLSSYVAPCQPSVPCSNLVHPSLNIASNAPNTGAYNWTVISSYETGPYVITISDANNNASTGVSGTFSIVPAGNIGVVFSVNLNNALSPPVVVVPGNTNQKLASFVFTAGNFSNVRVNTVNILTAANNITGNFQNLKLIINGSQVGFTQPTLNNNSSYTFTPSSPIVIPANGSIIVDVFADAVTSLSNTSLNQTLFSLGGVVGSTANSMNTVTLSGAVAGQVASIVINNGIIPVPNITPTPTPTTGFGIIGGLKVLASNIFSRPTPPSGETVTLDGLSPVASNPYFYNNVPSGSHIVSVTVPIGWSVGYTLCYNRQDCHTNTPTPGNSVTVNVPVSGYADLWWHFTPQATANPTPTPQPTPTPTITPTPTPTPTQSTGFGSVQGFKVMANNVFNRPNPPSGETVKLDGLSALSINPYYYNNISSGSHTVSVTAPSGWSVGYTLCYNRTDCHTGTPIPGNSVVVNIPASGYADLWWHYTAP